LMAAELARLGKTLVAPKDIAARQANLIGSFGREVETASGLADELTQLAAFNIPLERLQSYVADVSAVTAQQVQTLAARVYDPKSASLVVVGDGAIAYDALKKKRPALERIPIEKLNLDSATLQ